MQMSKQSLDHKTQARNISSRYHIESYAELLEYIYDMHSDTAG